MSSADDPSDAGAPDGAVGSSALAAFGQQNQLDFEIAFFDQILKHHSDYVDVLRCQGELLTHKGLHHQALKIDRRLTELLPDDCVARYNLACSLALVGDRREAVATLRTALEAGYNDFDYLARDNDLDVLRDDPAYRALLLEFAVSTPSRTSRPTDKS